MKLKKLTAIFTAAVMAFSMAMTANAEEVGDRNAITQNGLNSKVNEDGYVLVSEKQYMIDDFLIVDKQYAKDGISVLSEESGTVSIKNEVKIMAPGNGVFDWVEITLNGDFDWDTDADTVYVSNAKGDAKELGSPKITNKSFDSKSNAGKTSLLGKNYGYIAETVQMDNGGWHGKYEFTFKIDVNVKGEVNRTSKIV